MSFPKLTASQERNLEILRAAGGIIVAKGLNIRIDKLEDQPDLARAANAYHDCLVDNLARIKRPFHVQTRNFHP